MPASGDTLIFDTTTVGFDSPGALTATNDLSGLTGLALGFKDASSAGDFQITGGAFGLGGTALAATTSVGGNLFIANPIALGRKRR